MIYRESITIQHWSRQWRGCEQATSDCLSRGMHNIFHIYMLQSSSMTLHQTLNIYIYIYIYIARPKWNILHVPSGKEQCTVTSQETRHDSCPSKWASCGACLVRNQDYYITETLGICCTVFIHEISVFNVRIDSWVYLSINGPIFIDPCRICLCASPE